MNKDSCGAVILAAGEASRFGSAKQLVNIEGQAMLKRVMALCEGAFASTVVCLGAHFDEVVATLDLGNSSVKVARVDDWAQGMSASIHKGMATLEATSPDLKGVIVLLGDQPYLRAEDLACLLDAAGPNGEQMVATSYAGKAGVPAYIPKRYFGALYSLEGDQGARALLRQQTPRLLDFGERTKDIDLPSDIDHK